MMTLVVSAMLAAAPVSGARQSAPPQELVVASDIPQARRSELLAAANAFYVFWNTGDAATLERAISPAFVDHTLPSGRPQGPAGPLAASKAFLAAVPDLQVTVLQQLLVGDRVVSHLRFTGHFQGTFQGHPGASQPIDFIATDIVRVTQGRITDNWHLEDNLTLLQQMGLVSTGK